MKTNVRSTKHAPQTQTRPFAAVFVSLLLALLAQSGHAATYVWTNLVAGVDSETLPMVIYAMARRGVNPEINAISALITVFFGVLILISTRVREV